MQQFIVEEIIANLSFEKHDIGSFIIVDSDKKLMINKDYFVEIKPEKNNSTVVFVDGGNGELLRASNFSLHFVKLAAGLWSGKEVKRLQKEFFVLVKIVDSKYEAKTFGVQLKTELKFDLYDNKDATHRIDSATVAGHVRKIAELEFASEIASTYLPELIVRDGDLQMKEDFELKPFNELLKLNKNIFGLSKTCSLLTNTGVPANVALEKIAPTGSWFYNTKSDVCFVKLYASSKYVFRLDINDKEKMQDLLNIMLLHSKDPSFLGYPYGLIEVDLRARVTEQEVKQIKMNFLARHEKQLEPFLKSEDAHDVLNLL